jgi:phosphatidate phosphatase APP1
MSIDPSLTAPAPRIPAPLKRLLHGTALQAEDVVDTAWRRINARLGRDLPRHIAAYRGHGDARGVELCGRVLAEEPRGGPEDDDGWWDNLLATYRRFASREVPHAPVKLVFRDAMAQVESDHEGYYRAQLASPGPASELLWDNATASLADGSLAVAQPVLQVAVDAAFGLISDIDDTVLHSSIVDWKTAAQLTFLHNARTRKPLDGVAVLYQALQAGASGRSGHRRHPLFYVSSSPWNLYDLLEDFMELNAIPCGPIFLRDLGIEPDKFIKSPGHGHKLERAIALIERYPRLQWVLAGDSGQADAELYAEAAHAFPDRILAIYIRDVDPGTDSPLDRKVDAHIERVAGTSVPMLRARDSLAMAEHAAGLGLVDADAVAAVAAEVRRDRQRQDLGEAAGEAAREDAVEALSGME